MNSGVLAALTVGVIIAILAFITFCIFNCPWVLLWVVILAGIFGLWKAIKTSIDRDRYYN